MAAESCGNCKFAMAEGKQFICRRNPPVAHAIFVDNDNPDPNQNAIWPKKHVGTLAVYPPMQAHGWCGEWSHRLAVVSTVAKA